MRSSGRSACPSTTGAGSRPARDRALQPQVVGEGRPPGRRGSGTIPPRTGHLVDQPIELDGPGLVAVGPRVADAAYSQSGTVRRPVRAGPAGDLQQAQALALTEPGPTRPVGREQRSLRPAEHVLGVGGIEGAQAEAESGVGPDVVVDGAGRALGGQHEVDPEAAPPSGDVDQRAEEVRELGGQRGELVHHDHQPRRAVDEVPEVAHPRVAQARLPFPDLGPQADEQPLAQPGVEIGDDPRDVGQPGAGIEGAAALVVHEDEGHGRRRVAVGQGRDPGPQELALARTRRAGHERVGAVDDQVHRDDAVGADAQRRGEASPPVLAGHRSFGQERRQPEPIGQGGARRVGIGPPGRRPPVVLGELDRGEEGADRSSVAVACGPQAGAVGAPRQDGRAAVGQLRPVIGHFDAGTGAVVADAQGGSRPLAVGEPSGESPGRLGRNAQGPGCGPGAGRDLDDQGPGHGVGPRARPGHPDPAVAVEAHDRRGPHRVVGPAHGDLSDRGIAFPDGPQPDAGAGLGEGLDGGREAGPLAGGDAVLVRRQLLPVAVDVLGPLGVVASQGAAVTTPGVEVGAHRQDRGRRGDQAGGRVDGQGQDHAHGDRQEQRGGARRARGRGRGRPLRWRRRWIRDRGARGRRPMDRPSGWGHQGGTGRDVELEVHGADRQHGARPEGGGGAHGLAVQGRGRPDGDRADRPPTRGRLDEGVSGSNRGVIDAEPAGDALPDEDTARERHRARGEGPGRHVEVMEGGRGRRAHGHRRSVGQPAGGQWCPLGAGRPVHEQHPVGSVGPGLDQVLGGDVGTGGEPDLEVRPPAAVGHTDDDRRRREVGVGSGARPTGRGRAGSRQGPSIQIRPPCR